MSRGHDSITMAILTLSYQNNTETPDSSLSSLHERADILLVSLLTNSISGMFDAPPLTMRHSTQPMPHITGT